ncbi:hypothetical protein [Streptomyces sp. NPDC017941]|uniref:hypothetical protein n=1 Tax=Streptomyces sp. NPDC017941 TaxID=3365018 RepID=UPI0037B95749
MTAHRHYARLCRAAAVLLAAGAAYTGHHGEAIPTVGAAYGAAFLTWVAHCEAAADRRARVAARRAELAARPCPPPPDGPPLDDRERAALADIAAHYDHGTAA